MSKQNITVSGVWIKPSIKFDDTRIAQSLIWREVETQKPVLFRRWLKDGITAVKIADSGSIDVGGEIYSFDQVEYLHEGKITPELAKEIAEQKYPITDYKAEDWDSKTDYEDYMLEQLLCISVYERALTSLIVSEN